ncbi:MAG TPA: RAMP superfamily CRISPR-associated protein [Wenzhouxiangella sp.]|nr:RAMP superfamily CRISPR-associated protein [Wenzhouxiangella sp.]
MEIIKCQLRFLTPAFVGDANQDGAWRTPPIKALLRQWWRVVYAAENNFAVNVSDMRHREGMLFGHAWLEDDKQNGQPVAGRKSAVRIRLDRWRPGRLRSSAWPRDKNVFHPEVGRGGRSVGSALYLGYGPLTYKSGGSALKGETAIQDGETSTLSIAAPTADVAVLARVLHLIHRYGAMGGRSRNGWGSVYLEGLSKDEAPNTPLNQFEDCFNQSFPHAIAQDEEGPLIWETQPFSNWESVVNELADIKIKLRTHFSLEAERTPHLRVMDRQWLAYPVTNHAVSDWGDKVRFPNQLRFKVRKTSDGKLVGLVFHMPHMLPEEFNADRSTLVRVWKEAHQFLDGELTNSISRVSE